MQRTVAGVLAAVLALGVASCGGSDGPTKAEFAKQANAVCGRAAKQMSGANTSDPAEFAKRFLASQRAKVDGMADVTPPADLAGTYADYKKVLVQRLDVMRRYIAAAQAKRSTHELESPVIQARVREAELAKVLGLGSCREGAQ